MKTHRISDGQLYVRSGRIHVRPRLHLKSAVGYRKNLASRIELELLQAALGGRQNGWRQATDM